MGELSRVSRGSARQKEGRPPGSERPRYLGDQNGGSGPIARTPTPHHRFEPPPHQPLGPGFTVGDECRQAGQGGQLSTEPAMSKDVPLSVRISMPPPEKPKLS